MNNLEIRRTLKENVDKDNNVIFNVASPFSEGIVYDPSTGEITLPEIGQYSVKWWVATETSLTGCIQFALKSSQGDVLVGASPTKRGQVVGFGNIITRSENVTLALVNSGDYPVIMSKTSPVTAALIAVKIPEEGVMPTFAVDTVETLEPGEDATAEVKEDAITPDNWLFSFGIPKGETGVSPHIDTGTGNWFIGNEDTGVQARGPAGEMGPQGPAVTTIPFCISKYGVHLSTDLQGEPLMVSFSGFGGSYYESQIYLQEGEWATGTITFREDMNYGSSFIMPNKAILKKIYILFSCDELSLDEGNNIEPFVCLAISNADELVYTILENTITYTEPYMGGASYQRHALRRGELTNLNVEIPEGTLVAIVAGIKAENNITELNLTARVSGGIYFE